MRLSSSSTSRVPSADEPRREDIEAVFREFLGRAASPGDVEAWLRAGSLRALLDGVLASPEYAVRRAEREAHDAARARPFLNCWTEDRARFCRPPGDISLDGAVVVGEAGHLFIHGGTNSNVAMHRGEVELAPSWMEEWQALVADRLGNARLRGRGLVCVVVPEKLAVYADRYPADLSPRGPRPVSRLLDEGGLPLVYPLEALRDARDEGETYLFTDSHLTPRGNLVLAEAVVNSMGISAERLSEAQQAGDSYLAAGDLGRHFHPPLLEIMRPLAGPSRAVVVADNRAEIASVGGHIGTVRVFRREDASDERTVVVFGDSYGFGDDSYQGLSWFLAQVFHEVHFVWVPFGWDPNYLDRVAADFVVCETAERFVGRVPRPVVDVSSLAKETMARHQGLSEGSVFNS